MIYRLKQTTKYFADNREEAEKKVKEELESTYGNVVSQKITQKSSKSYAEYYEVEITREF